MESSPSALAWTSVGAKKPRYRGNFRVEDLFLQEPKHIVDAQSASVTEGDMIWL